jgi:hypothetical protein
MKKVNIFMPKTPFYPHKRINFNQLIHSASSENQDKKSLKNHK